MSEKPTATWYITLDTECPACKENVNLLDANDFWDGRRFDAVEHGTDRTRDVDVICPNCGHEFNVDFEY